MDSTSTPKATLNGLTFWPIPQFSDLELAFGAPGHAYFDRYNLPEVPTEHVRAANGLFFKGGALPTLDTRVDVVLANRATRAWLASFAPAHQAKEAAVGYAFWLWSSPAALDAAIAAANAEVDSTPHRVQA